MYVHNSAGYLPYAALAPVRPVAAHQGHQWSEFEQAYYSAQPMPAVMLDTSHAYDACTDSDHDGSMRKEVQHGMTIQSDTQQDRADVRYTNLYHAAAACAKRPKGIAVHSCVSVWNTTLVVVVVLY